MSADEVWLSMPMIGADEQTLGCTYFCAFAESSKEGAEDKKEGAEDKKAGEDKKGGAFGCFPPVGEEEGDAFVYLEILKKLQGVNFKHIGPHEHTPTSADSVSKG